MRARAHSSGGGGVRRCLDASVQGLELLDGGLFDAGGIGQLELGIVAENPVVPTHVVVPVPSGAVGRVANVTVKLGCCAGADAAPVTRGRRRHGMRRGVEVQVVSPGIAGVQVTSAAV